jgi:hypothetical protein
MVMENADGSVRSFGTWSKGVTTWLPETDLIAFYDHEKKESGLVEWDRALAELGDLLTPVDDVYPPRWSVAEFPSPERLAAAGYESNKPANS